MERGLVWLPLLALFIWLAWSGKKEYEKVEAYKIWAEQFDKSKYDIYAVLAIKGDLITWGKPTSEGITQQSSFSVQQVKTIELYVDNQLINLQELPTKGEPVIQFVLLTNEVIKIPFTEINLAAQWCDYLQKNSQI
jgi:hypothetical protein